MKLTKIQYDILCDLDYQMYSNYHHLSNLGYDRKELKIAIKELRDAGLVDYQRGLMNDDGIVCGSGFARKYGIHEQIDKLITEFEKSQHRV